MATDPYATLGVKRDAAQADIQKAYRRLAKKLHPDLNPGNKAAEEKFKHLSAAYMLLSDPEKRARFDRGEIDASGTEQQPRQYYRDFADREAGRATRVGPALPISMTSPAARIFSPRSLGAPGAPPGADAGLTPDITWSSTFSMP